MKRLALIIIILLLIIIAFFQYKSYTRFHPPNNYDYIINDSIDVNYYDQKIVDEYFNESVNLGLIAREAWSNHGIDVLYPDNKEEKDIVNNYVKLYKRTLSKLRQIEKRLIYSGQLKSSGYSNNEIEEIEELGINPKYYFLFKEFTVPLRQRDRGKLVWDIQKILNQLGNQIPVDGVFGVETYDAVREVQLNNDLYPDGILDFETLRIITKNK